MNNEPFSDVILWLDQVSKVDISLVGSKGANLGEMLRAGFSVPRAFCITTSAYRKQVEQTPIAKELPAQQVEHKGDYERLSSNVKALFLGTPIVCGIEEGIRHAYRNLG